MVADIWCNTRWIYVLIKKTFFIVFQEKKLFCNWILSKKYFFQIEDNLRDICINVKKMWAQNNMNTYCNNLLSQLNRFLQYLATVYANLVDDKPKSIPKCACSVHRIWLLPNIELIDLFGCASKTTNKTNVCYILF